jgi:predicted lipoprotein with Yx(FWY)xxD motif
MNVLTRPRNVIAAAAGLALLVAAFFVSHPGGARASSSAPVVRTAKNAMLGKTILVNSKGISLYSLSAERKGRFICTDATCLKFWTPLVDPMGKKPTGVAGLGTIRRPDHRVQVTYKGAPLYTFYLDHKRGQIGGNGFKDVGVWRVVTVGGSAAPVVSPGGGYGGYGG